MGAGSVPLGGTRKQHALGLFAGIPAEYDRAGAVLGLGQDGRWRRALVDAVDPKPSQRLLDVATGTGLVAAELVARCGCAVAGIDQSEAMLELAERRRRSDPRLAERTTLQLGQAEKLPFADGEFDGLTFTYLLRYVEDPAATMRELARVVRPGGRIAMQEFGLPDRGVLRTGWTAYTRLALPALGRIFSREWYEVGRFLGPSIEAFWTAYPLDRVARLWDEAGIAAVRTRRMSLGAGVVMSGVRDGDSG